MRKTKILILTLSLAFMVLTASSASADAWEVYTYDSGNFLARIFNALAIMTSLGDDGAMMRSLVKIAAISGLLVLLLSFLSTRIQHQDSGPDGFVHMLKQVLLTAIATWVLMVPKSNVLIVDRADPSQTQPVSDVPFATVIVAHFSSVLGDAIGQTIEDLLTDVDAIKFKNGGMALGARYLNEILDIDPPAAPAEYKVPNEYVPINMVLGEYFTRCVFPQFFSLPGDTSIQAQGMRTLMASPFLLTAFTNSIFRNKNTVFNNQFTEGEFPDGTTCYNAPGQILDKWTNVFTPWLSRFNYKIFGNDTLDPGSMDKAQAVFARYFGWSSVSDWEQNIMQVATLNAVRSEILYYQQSFSGASGAEEMMKKKTGEGWIYAARLFNKIIITMRQLAEALVYAAALFLPILFVIGGMNALFHYIKTHIWLQLWVPIFVLLNAFADYQLVRIVEAALNNPDIPAESLGISFQNLETLRTHANLILGYIGAFSWSVPTLAWGLVKGGEYAMTQAVSALSSGAAAHGEKTAQAVGSERGGGGRPEMPSFRNPTYGQFELSGNYAGAQARGFQAIRQQRLFETFGDRGLTQAAETSIAGGIGTHQGMGGARGVMETSAGSAERKKADWEAFRKEAQDRGYSSPGEMAKVFSQMDYGQKAQAIDDMAQKNNTSKEEAAQTLANATGDRHFLEAIKVSAGAREAGGVQSLASLTEARAEIDTSAQRSAIDTIRSNGFTPSDFGGQQGFMEAARTVAAMEAIKGGKLTNSELKASMETGILSEVGRNQAIDQASKTMGLDPKNFERVLKNWEGINEFQKFHMEQMFADRIGVSFPKLEAYKNSFMELSVPSGGLGQLGKEPNGLGDLSDIKADHRAEGYENLKKAGFDLERFNNDSHAYSEAAKITGLMRHIKGEDLTQKELSRAGSGGLFSESGLKQAIGKVSKAVGMEEKDLNKALNHWKGVSQFMELADSQGTMNRVWGLDLPALSDYRKSFEKMAAEPAPERAGADQSGKVSLAFTPDGKGGLDIVQQTRRAGTETKAGDFATTGQETNLLDKTSKDFQDVSKAGVLMSRGTLIDDKTAFEMAKKGDPELIRMVTNPYISDKERETQIGVLARTIGNAMSAFIERRGMSSNSVSGSANLSVGVGGGFILKAGGEARGGIEGIRTDQKITDLRIQESDTLIRESLKTAKERNLSLSETRERLSNAIADKIDAVHLEARSNSPDQFGATAPGDFINKYIKKGTDELQKGMSENPNYQGPR